MFVSGVLTVDRRTFFKALPANIKNCFLSLFEAANNEEHKPGNTNEFFASTNRSYPIVLAYPYEMLVHSATRLGIDPKGKTRLELAAAIIKKAGWDT